MLTKKDKYLAAAQKFLERGHDHRALEEFGRVVQEDPSDTRTWLKMAEIHVRHGALTEAREIYLRTAEIYIGQGFLPKAVTVYRSVLKLTPGLPKVRMQLSEVYRGLGMVADALNELEQAVLELQQGGRPADALPALRRIVELHPDNVVSRIRLAEAASQSGQTTEAIRELAQAADQLKLEGRGDEFVRVAERLLFLSPGNVAVARELAAAYIARKNPRLALSRLQGALKAAPRDPETVALLAEAMVQLDPRKAISVWRELAEIHAAAGREEARDATVRAALALDPADGATLQLAARWGISVAVSAARGRPPSPPTLHPSAVTSLRRPTPPMSAPLETAGMLSGLSRPGVSGLTQTPNDVTRILSEAEVFVKYGLAERAIDHLRRIFAFEPEHRGARERLAAVLEQVGRQREAAAELATLATQLEAARDPEARRIAERALSIDPSSSQAAKLLGRAPAPPPVPKPTAEPPVAADELTLELDQLDFFMQQSMHDEARAALVELEARFPGQAQVRARRRALSPIGAGAGAIPTDNPGAEPLHAPVAKLSPSEDADPATHGDLGIAYKQMGLYDAAVAEFRMLAADKTRAVFALTMIGECVEAKGELGEAVARYKEALNLAQATPQESVELYYLLGAVFEQLGDVREALYFFENVGKRDPGFRDVNRRIAALKTPSQKRA
ncbi:MAG TPA: tetratricopeptide repeat protein [Polyangia bacterium]|nr:tetratricopeptide repeat protein [Polyangia bacterium]